MDSLRSLGALIGRILLAFIFVNAGIAKLLAPAATMKYMAAGGLPPSIIPELFVLSVVVELIGGILLIVGYQASLVAFIMFLWCIPVTVMFHVMTGQTMEWHKNLAFMGGLLMVAVLGPGGFSVDNARRSRQAPSARAAA
jgi:putative oxidoreductase